MIIRIGVAVAITALVLGACGGGGSSSGGGNASNSGEQTTSVKVVGDSLNDSGTFGFKFTVQGTPPYPIWTERVASALSAPALCPRYSAAGLVLTLNAAATGCTSYGVGGARINPRNTSDDLTPLSILQQLKDLRAQGPYGVRDLLLVDGGGNDLADLAEDYAKAHVVAQITAFDNLTAELMSVQDKDGLTREQIGELYASRLADALVDALTTEALNRDAQRIVVLTAPDITRTPKFTQLMAAVAVVFPLPAAQVKTAVSNWVRVFNDRLRARLAIQSRVVVVDFYAELNKWLDAPATPAAPNIYGLTNTTTPACPPKSAGGLPTYDISACTDALLTGTAPSGDWWKTYVFSDNFHGTPRTNELMGDAVVKALEVKGWK